MSNQSFNIAVFPGDGIGVEIMDACDEVLSALERRVAGLSLHRTRVTAGAQAYLDTGVALSDEAMRQAEDADAILLGAMGWPDIRYPDGTEIAPQLDLRVNLELYAGVRPIRTMPGLPCPLSNPRAKDIDLVVIREQTEGLFWSRGRGVIDKDGLAARDTMVITKEGSRRVSDFAFRLAAQRKQQGGRGNVTCVDKSNVFTSMAFFRKTFEEVAAGYPELTSDHCYIDAIAYNLIVKPWAYDVIVTENMFGDILSDLTAALIGSMGMAPSGDVGDKHAMFQPAHGSAPDIAGKGIANPTAMFQSAAMMLHWLGTRFDHPPCHEAADILDAAVAQVFASGEVIPFEFGGSAKTADITRRVAEAVGA